MEFTSLLDTSFVNPHIIRTHKFLDDDAPDAAAVITESSLQGRSTTETEERGALIEELNRVSAENKKLTQLITVLAEDSTRLQNQLTKQHRQRSIIATTASAAVDRKRKAEMSPNNGPSECSSSDEDSCKKRVEAVKVSRVYVRTESSDVVQDGYQWRKYGQKVTRDNPCPRAYFKCSFAPACPVKKKVQRSVTDQSIVVATYEGEHNHPFLTKPEVGSIPAGAAVSKPQQSLVLDTSMRWFRGEEKRSSRQADIPDLNKHFVERMANKLTNDPSFKAALAAAVSGKFLQQKDPAEKWKRGV